jgi:hypothetical protein
MIFQTPCYPEGTTAADLEERGSLFERQLSPQKGHIFLFSRSSIQELLRRAGFPHVTFEPAIFAHYDMFLVAARSTLSPRPYEAAVQTLLDRGTFEARLVQALVDAEAERKRANPAGLRAEIEGLRAALNTCEADRAARLEVILNQGAELSRLRKESRFGKATAMEAEVQHLRHAVMSLTNALKVCEADRAARLDVIQRQGDDLGKIGTLQADAEYLTGRVVASEGEVERLRLELTAVRAALATSEASDRLHLQVVERQDAELQRLSNVLNDLGSLKVRLESQGGPNILERLVDRVRRAASDNPER